MTRRARNIGILALAAVVLVAVVLWQGRRAYLDEPPTLTAVEPDQVTRIELEIPPIPPQSFERRPDGWWRIKPEVARANDARLRHLANLAASPVARWIPAAAISPAKVGLDHPSATLTLDGMHLVYGGLTAIDDLRFVQVGNKVALVPRQYSPEVMLTKGQ